MDFLKKVGSWCPTCKSINTFHPFFTLNRANEFQQLHDMLYTPDHTCQSMSNMKASFENRKTKHMSKDKKKMHNWCLCCCLLLLGAIAWNLTTLGSHLVFAFKATHSKFIQLTFHFYRCFYKSRHAKKVLVKRVSKGQRATTNMKSVKVFFEHCCCLAFFLKRFISTSSLQTRMELQKNGSSRENILLEWRTKKGFAWDSRFCYGYVISLQVVEVNANIPRWCRYCI
jgi:hypothetical protein